MPIESIRSSFGLSQNGGIYFDGERIASQKNTIALMIGLGGMGMQSLLRVKNQVMNRMVLPSDKNGKPTGIPPKNIAFLEIDTSNSDMNNGHFSSTVLTGDEKLNISPPDGQSYESIVTHMLADKRNNRPYAQFLPDRMGSAGATAEAGAKRLMGRVALFYNASRVTAKIRNILNTLQGDNPGTRTKILIFVFAGIAGGTGSGMFLDLGYMLKTIVHNAEVMGYFYMSDLNDEDPGSTTGRDANTFAALKELDWAFERSRSNNAEKITYFYGPTQSDMVDAKGPYDYCHIINRTDNNNNVKSKKDVLTSVAESVFTYITDERSGGANNDPGVVAFYQNIGNHLLSNDQHVTCPASYNYISPNSSSLRVPYMEISTLIACRMFERLNTNVFHNTVTPEKFKADMVELGLGEGKECFQDALTLLLEQDAPASIVMDYKLEDIRGGRAWDEAYSEAQQYQNSLNACYGAMVGNDVTAGDLEGNLKTFLKSAIIDHSRGPFYLKSFIFGDDGTDNLYGLFTEQGKYFKRISNQCSTEAQKAKSSCEELLAVPTSDIGLFKSYSKRAYIDSYLDALNVWKMQTKNADKYSYLSRLCEELGKVYAKYYKNVLKPLADILWDLKVVFADENLTYLKTKEQEYTKNPDPSLIITPIEFERTYQQNFDACVNIAEQRFLNNLLDTMRDWIKTDIDHVTIDITQPIDIEGRLSQFISDCFREFYQTLSMEQILSAEATKKNMNLSDYVYECISQMYFSTYPLFKQDPNYTVAPSVIQNFAILSVPSNCATILQAADAFEQAHPNELTVKSSMEINRISMVKMAAGFALVNNAYLRDDEIQYEAIAETNATNLHIDSKWRAFLPSPNVETVWHDTHYKCKITQERNKKYRDIFICCYANRKIDIINDNGVRRVYLKQGNKNAKFYSLEDIDLSQADTPIEYLNNVINRMTNNVWDPENPQMLELEPKGQYVRNAPIFTELGANQADAELLSDVMENVIRNTTICEALEKEYENIQKIENLRISIIYPQLYVKTYLCNMFSTDKDTKDVYIKPNKHSPMKHLILDCADKVHLPDDYDYDYLLFQELSKILNQKINGQDETWTEVINQNWDSFRQQWKDKNKRAKADAMLDELYDIYGDNVHYYQKMMTETTDTLLRKNYQNIWKFYVIAKDVTDTLM